MTQQEQKLKEWLDGYKARTSKYSEPQRIAHRKEISEYLEQVGKDFNLK